MGSQVGSNALYLDLQENNMTYRVGNGFFSGTGFGCVAIALAGLALAGCGGGSTIEDAVPVAQGARDTGSYPNLNIKPEVAAEQFTDAEKNAKLSELKADRDQAVASTSGGAAKNDAAALGNLAKNHASDTLKQIENGQVEGNCDPALDPTCK